jgi:cytochrome oxidase assembly protein ShyY1
MWPNAIVTPKNILEVGFGFWPAKMLLTAVELCVFTTLGAWSLQRQTGKFLRSMQATKRRRDRSATPRPCPPVHGFQVLGT